MLGLTALILLVGAWWAGDLRVEQAMEDKIRTVYNVAGSLTELEPGLFRVHKTDSTQTLLYYLAQGSGKGYGGRLQTVTRISPGGNIMDVKTIHHQETNSFFLKVERHGFFTYFKDKTDCELVLNPDDITAISGATLTSAAIQKSVDQACRKTISHMQSCRLPADRASPLQIKYLDVWLVFLIFIAWLGTRRWMPYKKIMRWATMGLAFVVLGFVYNYPLTVIQVIRSLLGSFPDWREHLSFYILVFGFLGFIIGSGKNVYCDRVCPFVGLQEGLGKLGGAKPRFRSARLWLLWFQRTLVLASIIIAIYLRKPSITSYEVYGAFYKLSGSTFVFILLGIILISSMFILKPWCSYLCPIRPVGDYIRMVRDWIIR